MHLPRLLNWLRGLGGMKQLLIALIALTMTLGVACKKDEVKNEQPLKVKKMASASDANPGNHYPGCPGNCPQIHPPK